MRAGLLLLSGGEGRRMGAPKHALPHPQGGSWGGHLVGVFQACFPGGPVLVLGDRIPERPDLPRLEDPRQGPAVALQTWAAKEAPAVDRWWVVACDQVRWTPDRLVTWAAACQAADPEGTRWVLALHAEHRQPLGGWLPSTLRPVLAASRAASLQALVDEMPHLVLPQEGTEWDDLDSPEDRARWTQERG
jgi:molybdopterin-guanine dinucleotide biosynthesis protein A